MEKKYQKTIEKEVSLEGIGLHTGEKTRITFKSYGIDEGIVFLRKDIKAGPIKVDINNLLDTSEYPRRTSIGNEKVQIHTIEHLLSALYALEIDNILIEIYGSECPGLDGSSKPFVDVIKKSGIKIQNEFKEIYKVREPLYISSNGSHVIALPSDKFKISYTLDYPVPFIKSQFASFEITPEIYEKEIAPVRTFCLEEEVEI